MESRENQETRSYDNLPPEDEIDLADLVGVLYRQRWLIVGITLLITLLGLGYGLLSSEQYGYNTLIEVGQLQSAEGEYKYVESPKAAKQRLEASARTVYHQLDNQAGPEGVKFGINKGFTVEASEEGGVLEMNMEAPDPSLAATFLNELNRELINDHERILGQAKLNIKNEIERQELDRSNLDTEIENLQNRISDLKRQYDDKLKAKDNLIQELDNKIKNVSSQQSFLKEKIDFLEQEKEDLKKRIAETTERYDKLLESKLAASEKSTGGGAVGLMLFSSEVQNVQRYLSQLQDRLLLTIPGEISQMETKLKELANEISNIQARKNLEEQRRVQLEPELKEKIDEIKGQIKTTESQKQEKAIKISSLQNKLDSMFTTQVLMEPVKSQQPVAPNRKLTTALGLVLGLFMGIFMAFLWEFWVNNRERISRGPENSDDS
ncbi:MAG: Wzz/FepE/Etk N-terminal domain-containing protein [Desulfurivibrionaceae bacterium]